MASSTLKGLVANSGKLGYQLWHRPLKMASLVYEREIGIANGSAVDQLPSPPCSVWGVISMHSSGLGGGGVMLVYNRSLSQEASVIDFREIAPALAYSNMFKGNEMKAEKGILFRFVFSKDFLFQNQRININNEDQ